MTGARPQMGLLSDLTRTRDSRSARSSRWDQTGRIGVTFEHGHANHLPDDWSSVAYWYQTLPTAPSTSPTVEARLPLRPKETVATCDMPPPTDVQQVARDAAASRMQRFVELRDKVRAERLDRIDSRGAGNLAQSRAIRKRYDGTVR